MGLVDDCNQHFTLALVNEGFLDEPLFTLEMSPVILDVEGLAEDFEDVGIGVQGPANGDHQHSDVPGLRRAFQLIADLLRGRSEEPL